jgi:hypothetical protein
MRILFFRLVQGEHLYAMRANDVTDQLLDHRIENPVDCYPLRSSQAPNQLHFLGTLSLETGQRTNGQTNGPTDQRMGQQTDQRTDQLTSQRTIGPTDQPTDRPTDADRFYRRAILFYRGTLLL